ncbi:cytochrome b5 reductase 4 isoform X2 [Rhineura floridana]|uniref:cytochrome b5 reductase 4 isoform X2 n=1 Tax=Rhineura floridana TaxID=261503 RepID=UPI002AC87F92|nr:cytochrome b5 reductase 4 isoform X2 [Rhineura floridana]
MYTTGETIPVSFLPIMQLLKVPLKPGRSLMDWIRLTKSGKDLTGLKGRLVEVTEEELSKHNKKDDCWICIRGLVYNITPYMEYHPGGEDELMKAAGADGTDLFDQVHRWVNYESMLKECMVGRMALKPFAALKETCPTVSEENRILNGLSSKNKVLDNCSKEVVPSYDWFQTDGSVTVVIYAKQKDMDSELVIADLQQGRLRGELIVKDYSYLLHLELSYAVHEDMIVQVSEKVGKVEFVLKKKETLSWKKLGQPLESHNSFVKRTERGLFYRKCRLLSKTNVSHDTRLFCLMLPPGTHLQIPVGHHLYLKQTITGTEIVKPYTPVSSFLVSTFKTTSHDDKMHIFFMIKIYPSGLFTPVLDTLQIGQHIFVSNPEGNFMKSQTEDVEDLFLLAGGTGFTPMIKLLKYALTSSNSLRAVKFMFFNKTEDDILWRNQLEQLARNDSRFDIQFVLSEPKKGWTGKQGKISFSFLSQFVKRSKYDSKILICICGPLSFTEQGMGLLQDLGHSCKEMHCFTA